VTVLNAKVLVEGSKFLRLAKERALSKSGYEVSVAADGEEALRVANDKLPDMSCST
jgi:DNA-binding response OmpR family regulator